MLVAQQQPKPKILVVEDSYLTAEAVCDMVKRCGCDVAAAVGRVETGVEFLCQNDVDGAVVDIDLRGTTSFPLCDQLRKREIPFLFLTGYGPNYVLPPEFQDRPRLFKPLDDREFESALATLTSGGQDVDRGNLVLGRLSAAHWRAVLPRLERATLDVDQVLETPGAEIRHVYFPVSGLISVRAVSTNGKRIEVGLVGREGVTGIGALLASTGSEVEAVVQHRGEAWRLPAAIVPELQALPELYSALLAAAYRFTGHMARNSLAIGYGTIEQRLARRLLTASIRLGSKTLAITHDSLSRMLAVRRSGVTVALHMLESREVIRARRNVVEILDYGALMREAGEICWGSEDVPAGGDC
ncbi:cAMP-binding domain of CRP or a regulatory subunit of cAMP-dependent protein kinases [Enhydrobacter aerosaccus]|uniref:cAMP-binding domain of CRP or a regulatory subunit of cAMP-dependent protein kinases n=1 Tax=Enhydrobacter aerosaccus TaxID=225324 RepID=A0A1T4NVX1_9HYPH|nr:helix-turn-helix domain-containing protein [Enhydrobacter aerosaccus]SJZ83371.1 cAMP-binding domain of CRP or a regulatory subunit of cAMP-dependent protein kinases [Enhydrobacter aerosaccus]